MRGFIIFVLVGGVVFVYLRQKQDETTPNAAPHAVTAQAKAAPLTPAPRGQASEYNWMKRSLDRARDVADESRARTAESQKQ
jgi:hypothetical protein